EHLRGIQRKLGAHALPDGAEGYGRRRLLQLLPQRQRNGGNSGLRADLRAALMRILTIPAVLLLMFGCGRSSVEVGYPADYPQDAGSSSSGLSAGGTGLPCNVENFLKANCQACHGNPPLVNVPMSLVTYADLKAPSPTVPSRTVAEQ